MNNDIAKDAARIKRLAEGAALAILTADNDSSFSAAEVEAVARPIRETLEAATAADKERIASLEAELESRKRGKENFDRVSGEVLTEAHDLRAQLAAKTQECEGLRDHLEQVTRIASRFSEEVSVPEAKAIEEAGALLDSARKEGT